MELDIMSIPARQIKKVSQTTNILGIITVSSCKYVCMFRTYSVFIMNPSTLKKRPISSPVSKLCLLQWGKGGLALPSTAAEQRVASPLYIRLSKGRPSCPARHCQGTAIPWLYLLPPSKPSTSGVLSTARVANMARAYHKKKLSQNI